MKAPANSTIRLQSISLLRIVDRRTDARLQTQACRTVAPSNLRIDAMMKQMADMEHEVSAESACERAAAKFTE
ncbi:hypothetical protein [Rubripirellula lacrimiformis]|uniref:hypothetical protein n=1 Tax=Rubripirellula lacrimiformis TaxID=1930273 RepID=UPI0011A811D2|nr:hypothetical protein [Rubripirellula lacrimiformis]